MDVVSEGGNSDVSGGGTEMAAGAAPVDDPTPAASFSRDFILLSEFSEQKVGAAVACRLSSMVVVFDSAKGGPVSNSRCLTLASPLVLP